SEKSKADLIEERYPQVDFNQVLLGASMLSAILLRGEMDAKKLVGAIDQSSDYMNPGEQPLWLRAMQFFNSDDAMCASIAEEVEAAFTNREFIVRGEFLHIVGLRLFFAKIGQISKSPGDVATESRAYIDDLARDDRLETSFDRPRDPSPENIYGAYAIIQSDTPEYRGIVEYYDQAAQKQQEKRYPEIARQLLAQLSVDPDGFFFELSPNAFRTGKYWHHPVLASLPPCEYARVVFDASPEIQSSAIKMLLSRHDGRRGVLLQAERPWVAQVKTELEKLILTAQPMTRHRLKNLIAQNLDPLLAADGAGKAVG
ncbi:MAG: hypothetical protein KGH70_08760, partial [Rhodospirillales bacterium]|nr:hypothetical protein [Rhodospirillales bacterium]